MKKLRLLVFAALAAGCWPSVVFPQAQMVAVDPATHMPRQPFSLSGSQIIGKLDAAHLPASTVRNYTAEATSGADQRIAGKTASATTQAVFSRRQRHHARLYAQPGALVRGPGPLLHQRRQQ